MRGDLPYRLVGLQDEGWGLGVGAPQGCEDQKEDK
jgi:hypothetical protein